MSGWELPQNLLPTGMTTGESKSTHFHCQLPGTWRNDPVARHQAYRTARYSDWNKGQKYCPMPYIANKAPILGRHFRPLQGGEGTSPGIGQRISTTPAEHKIKTNFNILNYSHMTARRIVHSIREAPLAVSRELKRHRKTQPAGQRLSALPERETIP